MQNIRMETKTNTFENFPEWLLEKWQGIADVLAETIGVTAALITKTEDDFMEVFISSHSENNPYPSYAKENMDGLYSETVIKTQQKLLVTNALTDKAWDNNPALKLGMIAYLGFPLNFPDHQPFGTLCLLDNKERLFTLQNEKLVQQFKNVIELDLALLQSFEHKTSLISANIVHEIAERKKADEKLQESERMYRNLFEKANEGLILLTMDGKIAEANQSFAMMHGYTVSEIKNMDIKDLDVLNDRAFDGRAEVMNRLYAGEVVRFEVEHYHKDGHVITMSDTVSIINIGGEKFFLAFHQDITGRKLAEEQLAENKEKYRGLSEASFESIFLSEKGICIEQNHTAEKTFGYTSEEAIGRYGTDWIVPEYRDLVLKNMLSVSEEPYEARALRKDGTTFPCMLSGKMMHYKGRDVRVTSLTDITERKHAEASIQHQLKFTHALNEIAGVIISTEDINAIIEKTTTILGETLGVDRCLIYDVNFPEKKLTATSEWLNPEFPDIQPTKGVYSIEIFISGISEMEKTRNYMVSHSDEINPVLFPDNSYKILHDTMEIKSAIWYPFNFYADGYFLLVLNETHHKREFVKEEIDFLNSFSKQVGIALEKINLLEGKNKADEIIKASEKRFRNVLQDVKNIAVQGYASDGTTQYWNKASEILYGFTAQEAIGKNLLDLIIPFEIKDHVSEAIKWMIETGQSIPSSELSLQRKDGSRVSVYSHHTMVKIPGNQPEFFCIDIDLTDRKLAEERILELNRDLELRVKQRTSELEAVNKELETFSYSVSHDLKAPLRHISGFIGLFLENKPAGLSKEQLGFLDVISSSVSDMEKLIDSILTFSRLNSIGLQKKLLNSSEMVHQAIAFFNPDIQHRKIIFQVEALPDIKGDEELLCQVWINLISNAIKYTMKKPEAIIEIGSFSSDNEATFFVKDNGAGFNMKYADKLFGVFKRLHRSSDFEGVGIGLANVNRIVKRHGGHCHAEGEVDNGATFYFTLPV